MAKSKSSGEARKVNFGKRKEGKAKKSKGPKDKKVSVYKGQGKI